MTCFCFPFHLLSRSLIRKNEHRIQEYRNVTTATERAVSSASDSLDTVHSRLATMTREGDYEERKSVSVGDRHRRRSCHCTFIVILRNHRDPARELTVTSCSCHKNYGYFLLILPRSSLARLLRSSRSINAIAPILSAGSSAADVFTRASCLK